MQLIQKLLSSAFVQAHLVREPRTMQKWAEVVLVSLSCKTFLTTTKKNGKKKKSSGLADLLRPAREDLVADEALEHHHEAPRPLAQGAVGVLLQESEQLGPDLGQHGGHVVSGQRVAVIQVHHRVLQVAGQRRHSG